MYTWYPLTGICNSRNPTSEYLISSNVSTEFCCTVGIYEACESETNWKVHHTPATYEEAQRTCRNENKNLASVHYTEENDDLVAFFHPTVTFWIGLRDEDHNRSWTWEDGSLLDYTQWYSWEPNNHDGNEYCVSVDRRFGRGWNDAPCGTQLPFVCK